MDDSPVMAVPPTLELLVESDEGDIATGPISSVIRALLLLNGVMVVAISGGASDKNSFSAFHTSSFFLARLRRKVTMATQTRASPNTPPTDPPTMPGILLEEPFPPESAKDSSGNVNTAWSDSL